MPVRFGSEPSWHISHFYEDGRLTITRGTLSIIVSEYMVRIVEDEWWFEDVQGADPILHFGLDELVEGTDPP